MTKLVSLELDYKIKVSSRVHDFLSPDYVYFPLNKTSKLLVKDKQNVLKGQRLFYTNNKTTFCSVSGKVAGIKRVSLTNEVFNYLVIENDYKEKTDKKITKKSLNIKSINELHTMLKEYCENFEFQNKNTLLLNVIDNEPYIVNKSMYFCKNLNYVLETLDELKKIIGYKEILILLKSTETVILTKINDLLGTYPDFRVVTVPNCYLINRKDYYKDFIECSIEDIFELDLNTFIKIGEIVEKNKPVTEKYITITGDAVKNPLVINVKLGTLVKNIIEEEMKLLNKNDKLLYHYNGLMSGEICDKENLVIDENFEGLIITNEQQVLEEKCIKCGLCLKHCPLNINPIEHLTENKEIKCLNCGLCSYVCPSNINFKKITKKDDSYE